MTHIAFIDCFMQSPVNKCVNNFVLRTGLACTYHMPSLYGFESLQELKQVDGFIILGSASHVTQRLDWHQQLKDYLIPKLENNTPTFGICFGHQLIADHYGSRVDYIQEDQFKRVEVRDVKTLRPFLGLKAEETISLAFSHSQMVHELSDQFIHLAESPICKYEAIQHKGYPFWSFQAHPEATIKFITENAQVTDQSIVEKTLSSGQRLLDGFIQELRK
jgi:GMP synthase (glutamine-hydrolysing)